MTKQELQRAVDELVAVNEALLGKLHAQVEHNGSLCEKLAAMIEERDEAIRERDARVKWWREEADKHKATTERALRYEQERDKAQQDLQAARWTLVGVEREREAARAIADAMRQRAFPAGPEFPWEQRRSAEEAVHMHYTAERR